MSVVARVIVQFEAPAELVTLERIVALPALPTRTEGERSPFPRIRPGDGANPAGS